MLECCPATHSACWCSFPQHSRQDVLQVCISKVIRTNAHSVLGCQMPCSNPQKQEKHEITSSDMTSAHMLSKLLQGSLETFLKWKITTALAGIQNQTTAVLKVEICCLCVKLSGQGPRAWILKKLGTFAKISVLLPENTKQLWRNKYKEAGSIYTLCWCNWIQFHAMTCNDCSWCHLL